MKLLMAALTAASLAFCGVSFAQTNPTNSAQLWLHGEEVQECNEIHICETETNYRFYSAQSIRIAPQQAAEITLDSSIEIYIDEFLIALTPAEDPNYSPGDRQVQVTRPQSMFGETFLITAQIRWDMNNMQVVVAGSAPGLIPLTLPASSDQKETRLMALGVEVDLPGPDIEAFTLHTMAARQGELESQNASGSRSRNFETYRTAVRVPLQNYK